MEQLDRATRYLERMREIYAGTFSTHHDKDRYEDDVVSFFVHCHHVGDWFTQLNKVGMTQAQVNAFINRHEALRVCADLCNGSKHYKLTRTLRTGRQPHIALKQYKASTWLTNGGGGEVLEGRYSILTASGTIDALALAEQCLKLWTDLVAVIREVVLEGRVVEGPELFLAPTPLAVRPLGG
jgi:hypothetical protein